MNPEDINAAKDAVIVTLTNSLIRAEAELAALRRQGETDGSDSPGP